MAYDPKCHELAEYFLCVNAELNDDAHIDELAETIQQAIEDWIKGSTEGNS